MRQMRNRSFFELTWTIFRFAMKLIFIVLCILYLFAGLVVFLLSPELGHLPAEQFLVSLGSALLFGIVFVSYVTLLAAVPVSAFCALAAFSVTAVVRLYETAFPPPPGVHWSDYEPAEPGAVEVIATQLRTESANCPVCSSALEDRVDLMSCLRCESLHHAECWTYVGSCATFGCGSDRARPSREPAPAATPEDVSGWRRTWARRSETEKAN